LKKVNLENTDFSVLLPEVEYFVNKIKNNDVFHFIRANHGIFDNFGFTFADDFSKLENLLTIKNYKKISEKIISYVETKGWYKDGENIKYYFNQQKSTEDKLYYFIKLFTEYKSFSEKINIGVSLGVGLGDIFGTYHAGHPIQERRKTSLIELTKNSNGDYYHSGIIKHYSIMGEFKQIIDVCNDLDFNIVFLGHRDIDLIKNEYDIKNYYFIEIPKIGAADEFDDTIEKVLEIKNNQRKTILLSSCGHILSFYLSYKLISTDIFLLDIGKSFEYEIKKYLPEDAWKPYDDWAWPHGGDTPIDRYIEYIKNLRK
jgi:hypothetical protein